MSRRALSREQILKQLNELDTIASEGESSSDATENGEYLPNPQSGSSSSDTERNSECDESAVDTLQMPGTSKGWYAFFILYL